MLTTSPLFVGYFVCETEDEVKTISEGCFSTAWERDDKWHVMVFLEEPDYDDWVEMALRHDLIRPVED